MRNLLISIAILTGVFSTLSAQNIQFKDSLATVYLSQIKTTPVVETSLHKVSVDHILTDSTYNIRQEIRKARRNRADVLFLTAQGEVKMSRYEYLKMLKRAANRSDNASEFKVAVTDTVPELSNSLKNSVELEKVYETIRKDTFNGRLSDLPAVL